MRDYAEFITPQESRLDVEHNTRFTIWDGNRPIGEYLVHIFEMPSEVFHEIQEVIPHSENGRDLDWEEVKSIREGFCKDYCEEILKVVETGEDGYVKGKYIKVFPPSFPLPKDWNPKFRECHEMWMKDGEFQETVLDVIGEADYDEVWKAFNDGKWIAWRYINQEFYTDSVTRSAGGCTHIQLFADGVNLGWCEDHPHREYKKLEDGRTVAIGEPTLYYDFLLKTDGDGHWLVKSGRTRSLFCWIKKN